MTRKHFFRTITAGTIGAGAAGAQPMPGTIKIASVKPVVIKATRGYAGWVFVRVQTDQGIEGIGEAFSWGGGQNHERVRLVRDAVDTIGSQITGANALEIGAFVNRFAHRISEGYPVALDSGLWWVSAVSAIEIALWDIAGQSSGLPIHALLGGRVRAGVPLYANHGAYVGIEDTAGQVERAIAAKEAGFRMFKFDPFGPSHGDPSPPEIKAYRKVAQAFRSGLGEDFKLAVDGHVRFDLKGGLRAAKELEDFNLVFFEEPIPPGRPDLFRKIAASTPIPLAAGERIFDRMQVKEVLDSAIRVIQPEVGNIGGILEMRHAAALAELYDAAVAPHCWCGPVVARAAAHVSVTLPNLLAQEYPSTAPQDRWENDLLEPPTEVKNGEILLSDRPGLGSKFNEKLLASRIL
ncbi:MAG: mandelate racemase/muconate lactonizing enzyme family protein [Bryobacteraceae bacterium]